MSFTKGPASVTVTEFKHGSVFVDAFQSRKEAVQHYLCSTSLAGYWGSEEQLAALIETRDALHRTITCVRREIETKAAIDADIAAQNKVTP